MMNHAHAGMASKERGHPRTSLRAPRLPAAESSEPPPGASVHRHDGQPPAAAFISLEISTRRSCAAFSSPDSMVATCSSVKKTRSSSSSPGLSRHRLDVLDAGVVADVLQLLERDLGSSRVVDPGVGRVGVRALQSGWRSCPSRSRCAGPGRPTSTARVRRPEMPWRASPFQACDKREGALRHVVRHLGRTRTP